MIAPSLVVVSVNDAAGSCPLVSKIALKISREMARVVSFNGADTAPSGSHSLTLAPAASPAAISRRVGNPSTANVAAPSYKNETLSQAAGANATVSMAVGADAQAAVSSTKQYPSPAPIASDGSAAKEAGGLVFHRSQAGRIVPKNRKYSANSVAGRWTGSEHEAFLKGLKVYGREWKKVARCIPTRTSAQIRSHAQKYFAKVSKEQQHLLALTEQRRSSFAAGLPSKSDSLLHHEPRSKSFITTMNSVVSHPAAVEGRVCKTLALLRERYKQLQCMQEQLQNSPAPAPVACHLQVQSGGAAPLGPTAQDHLQKSQAPATGRLLVRSGEVALLGPATAALEVEQHALRAAATARRAAQQRSTQLRRAPAGPRPAPSLPRRVTNEADGATCARVAVTAIPVAAMTSSHGLFDSSDVIALSRLGGHLGREQSERQTGGAAEGVSSLKAVRERPQLIEQDYPSKLRKLAED